MKDMTPEVEELQNKCQVLESKNSVLEDKVAELQLLVKHYEERYRLSRQKKFGASSEKTSPEQGTLGLLDEAENEANARVAEPPLEIIAYKRRKHEGKREEDLSELPVETIEHVLPEGKRLCPSCGGPMHVMDTTSAGSS